MKIAFSIFLLLITSLYVMQVKETFAKSDVVCITDMDDEKSESDKKEKSKDLFKFPASNLFLIDTNNIWHQPDDLEITLEFYTIETPPPDKNI